MHILINNSQIYLKSFPISFFPFKNWYYKPPVIFFIISELIIYFVNLTLNPNDLKSDWYISLILASDWKLESEYQYYFKKKIISRVMFAKQK